MLNRANNLEFSGGILENFYSSSSAELRGNSHALRKEILKDHPAREICSPKFIMKCKSQHSLTIARYCQIPPSFPQEMQALNSKALVYLTVSLIFPKQKSMSTLSPQASPSLIIPGGKGSCVL